MTRSTAEPTRDPRPEPSGPRPAPSRGIDGTGRGLAHLQRAAGNRAVTDLLVDRRAAAQRQAAQREPAQASPATAQRVPVTAPSRQETLFNQRPTPGQASPAVYGSSAGAKFDMSRSGTPESVISTVRIRFFDQARGANMADTGPRTVLAATDPRRAWAQGMCTTAPALWNGRAKLVGDRSARTGLGGFISPDAGGRVELPLVFRSVPVWDLTSPADTEVRVFGTAIPGNPATGNPIDSGHYYMNRGNYPFTDDQIYAHEYGHLLGLPDEYSQSNPQMHALMHDMDPATAAARGAALDKETVRRTVMAALTRPLFDRLTSASAEISRALAAGAGPVRQSLAGQLRASMSSASMQGVFQFGLPPASARLAPRIPALLRTAANKAANTSGLARQVVAAEFAVAPIGNLIHDQYWSALLGAQSAADVGGGLQMHIVVEGDAGISPIGAANVPPSGLWNSASTGPTAGNAAAIADNAVGALQTGRVPPVRPSASLLRELEALPAGWAAFTASAPAALSAGTLTTDMSTAIASAWAARVAAGGAAPATLTTARALSAAINGSVHAAALAAATNAVRAFLSSEINPLLDTSVTTLIASVNAEVDRVMSTPAGGVAATAPRDPDIAALATSMKVQMDAQNTAATAAQTGAGTPAVNPGGAVPAQGVTYDTVNMMSDNTSAFRVDQFKPLADQFNAAAGLRKDREGPFAAEMV